MCSILEHEKTHLIESVNPGKLVFWVPLPKGCVNKFCGNEASSILILRHKSVNDYTKFLNLIYRNQHIANWIYYLRIHNIQEFVSVVELSPIHQNIIIVANFPKARARHNSNSVVVI